MEKISRRRRRTRRRRRKRSRRRRRRKRRKWCTWVDLCSKSVFFLASEEHKQSQLT